MCAVLDSSGSSPTTEDVAVQGGTADVVDGTAGGSLAEAEGVQHIPQSAATADAPGSFRPCGPLPCVPTPCALSCTALV